jgi:hypothetical protein
MKTLEEMLPISGKTFEKFKDWWLQPEITSEYLPRSLKGHYVFDKIAYIELFKEKSTVEQLAILQEFFELALNIIVDATPVLSYDEKTFSNSEEKDIIYNSVTYFCSCLLLPFNSATNPFEDEKVDNVFTKRTDALFYIMQKVDTWYNSK